MSRVADKIVMIVRSATKVVARTTMPRSATYRAHDIVATLRDKALRAACGVRLRHVSAQQPIAGTAACNPFPHRTLTRTASGVLLPANGAVATRYWRSQPLAGATACDHSRTNRFAHRVMVATIRVVTFLAIHPVKPLSRPCGTYSEVPYGHQTS
jgi:hypothetical protein